MSDAYQTEERTVHGRRVKIMWEFDNDHGSPWETQDGHGPVRQSAYSHRSLKARKRPGERPMNAPDRNHYQYFYDWQSAMQTARKVGWYTEDIDTFMRLTAKHRRTPTKGMVAEYAVQRDFDYLAGWLNGKWHWCGIVVQDVETGVKDSLWRIESDAEDYHTEVINDLANDMWLDVLEELLGCST